ncbi:ABC1 kinase family protein [Rubrivivax rivuli]|uniref:AarF/ABC1/UbiB kinase family protein n=1 Tax=Rubrivivax rivuli TaxID=1862385 RepID=A0A437RAD9_9BURK|nr:AarF/ABC1/UbiB kinase family protein [Rubrivivax rivuli]RVU43776.1 AarF/ABC1/UbiB kinase family protein [Rubrivivax rivuli]
MSAPPAPPAAPPPPPPPAGTAVRAATVPEGRTRRLLHFGRAVGEMAAGAAAEGVAQLARGQRPALAQLMLTPANARRLAERLSQMRGAVMKVGQLLSMDGHGVLPPHFAELLGGLRDQAHVMPATQLAEVLEREYGPGWHRRFKRLSFEPVAAASIGQVHRAETHDGRVLALKIQYPGVRRSIGSDMANLALLLRTPGLVPAGLDPGAMPALLARVQAQLEHETDYLAEVRAAKAYREKLGDDPVLTVPAVDEEHCTGHIIATAFAPGVPVDRLAAPGVPQAQRNHVAMALSRLAVHEFFRMRLVQTDPNFGNYLFDADTGRIALIDFGATELVTDERVEQLRELGRALRADDVPRLQAAAQAAGFTAREDPPAQSAGVIGLMRLAGEPLRHAGAYDFGVSTLFARSFEQGRAQFFGDGYARTPPPDLLFLQRKFAGTFMLCTRLRAQIDLADVFGAEL